MQPVKLDGDVYEAWIIRRAGNGGQPEPYCPLAEWDGSEAQRLHAAYQRIADLESQLGTPAPAAASAEAEPAEQHTCPVCERVFKNCRALATHRQRSQHCQPEPERKQEPPTSDHAALPVAQLTRQQQAARAQGRVFDLEQELTEMRRRRATTPEELEQVQQQLDQARAEYHRFTSANGKTEVAAC